MMLRLLFLLSMSALCLTLPIKDFTLDISNPPESTSNSSETKTFPASDVFIPSLLPPSSIIDCLTSGYCNQGNCVSDGDFGPIFCTCHPPFVDSEEGLCTARGKSQ